MVFCLLFVDVVQTFGFDHMVNEEPSGTTSAALLALEMKTGKYSAYKNSLALA